MKKLLLAAFAVFPGAIFAQENFTITGKVGNLDAPAKAYLNYRAGAANVLDSADISNGQFTFTGSVANPLRAFVLISHDGADIRRNRNADRVEIYLEDGAINVSTGDSLINATVSGGPANHSLNKHRELSAPAKSKMDALNARFFAASDEQRQNPKFMSGLQAEAGLVQQEQKAIDLEFLKSNPESPVSLDLLGQYVDSEPLAEVIEPAFNSLSDELRNSDAGKTLMTRMEAMKNVDIGAIAPEFAQPDTAGNMVSLSDFRGQYVLIDFWASWCGPCRQENPNVVAAFNKFKDKNFTILGVSLDQPGKKDAWMKAIHDDGLQHWTNVSELKFWQSDVVAQYAIRGIPQNFLLDPEGRIIAKNLRGENLHKKLEEVLN